MTDLSEETGQRIAKALERLANFLESQPPAGIHSGHRGIDPHFVWNPNRCAYCFEDHGGLTCPKLQPTAIGQLGKMI